MRKIILAGLLALAWLRAGAQAGPMRTWHAGEIKAALEKTQVLGAVLYLAAHPDDENTRFIAYAAKGLGLRTGYLSLTRGDGGQNLIGKEVRELLGLIRTQELLAARRLDGGEQFFTRANDFGFSKHPDETMDIWERDEVLADAVWIIRQFRPDVIVTRFSPGRAGSTHGHHTASAMLAIEAAKAAADPQRFPEQLQWVQAWAPKRVVWNTSSWFFQGQGEQFDASKYMTADVGAYHPLLGASYNEIAAHSRTMHKSQGFGSAVGRGEAIEYFQHLYGDSSSQLLGGIDLTWARVPGSEQAARLLAQANASFDYQRPEASVPALAQALQALRALPDSYWVKQKSAEVEALLLQCAGVWAAAESPQYHLVQGDSLRLQVQALRRAGVPVRLVSLEAGGQRRELAAELPFNQPYRVDLDLALPPDIPLSHPYWLRETPSKGMYRVPDQLQRGQPENAWTVSAKAVFEIAGVEVPCAMPALYRWTDPVAGELHRPLEVVPAVTANLDQPTYVFASEEAKAVRVRVKGFVGNAEGILRLRLPKGWRAEPQEQAFALRQAGEEALFEFQVFPGADAVEASIEAEVLRNGQASSHSLLEIDYPHIPRQTLFPPASSKAVRLDIRREGQRIGYLMGAGDAIPEALEQIGYEVDILGEQDVTLEKLQQYDAVIAGVRAYNTLERMPFLHPILMQYVEAGGHYMVQYNTSNGLKTKDLGPYPLTISRGRVTVEEAPVRVLAPDHRILQYPNAIGPADFEGWEQERGLYFPGKWDARYTALLSSNDPGEEPLDGGLLVAEYGKGSFIYTGYSWFRELPAGVPGAYRLFVNLISYRQHQPEAPELKDKQ
jgi:LmbE family N-acetylglucosaminyl deacetylase